MATKLKMIQEAQSIHTANNQRTELIISNVTFLAEQANVSTEQLLESVLSVLANFANYVQQGKKVLSLNNINSMAAFLAGIETINTAALNNQIKPAAIPNVIAAYANAKIEPAGGVVSHDVQAIVDVGAKHADLVQKYRDELQQYLSAPNAAREATQNQLLGNIRKLQQFADSAIRKIQGSSTQVAKPQPQGQQAQPQMQPRSAR